MNRRLPIEEVEEIIIDDGSYTEKHDKNRSYKRNKLFNIFKKSINKANKERNKGIARRKKNVRGI